jgi:hypothetical protein
MRAVLLFVAGLGLACASAAEHGDLRGGVTVGMSAAELPTGGYKDFVCVAPKGKSLGSFAEWKTCEPDADGLRDLHAAIDEPGTDDTLVAGHPVNLTLGFDGGGRLARIVIETKSKGPMYLRKKAFLLGLQAKARYGDSGWDCREFPLNGDEEPLGPTSVKEHCVKSAGERKVTIDRSLFRKVGAEAKAFTSESHVVIDWAAK